MMIEFLIAASAAHIGAANSNQSVTVKEVKLAPIARGENDDILFQTMCDVSGQYCVRLNRFYADTEFHTNLTLIEKSAAGNIEYLHEEAIESKSPDSREIGQVYPKIYIVTDAQNPAQKTIIFGVIDNKSGMYSGGGESSQNLHLFETVQSENAMTRLILVVPIYGYKMIRACFSENDMRLRRGACHDEYTFNAELRLAGQSQNGRPIFAYQSYASDFPKGASLNNDNSGIRLKKSDIVKATNPKCTIRRTFIYKVTDKFYRPTQEFPDCSDYF